MYMCSALWISHGLISRFINIDSPDPCTKLWLFYLVDVSVFRHVWPVYFVCVAQPPTNQETKWTLQEHFFLLYVNFFFCSIPQLNPPFPHCDHDRDLLRQPVGRCVSYAPFSLRSAQSRLCRLSLCVVCFHDLCLSQANPFFQTAFGLV